ncbi:hypothetical protein IFM89_003680 [Coptis chinensis]|uniref:Uncharacterized protein n=1 Tax=Coptis chinensis TaxID=261450 RepID=A0A835M8K1_9MAGN|nr:hypothetical protein IFM89_003680 [Coptis chinensis]
MMGQEESGGSVYKRNLSGRRLLYRCAVDMDDRGWTSLHIVSKKGDLKKRSSDEEKLDWEFSNKRYMEGDSGEEDFEEEVKRLLNEGMDVNVSAWGPKWQGVTPLHLAAQGGHLKVMDALLERGANIDARTKGACGWTPLHNAAKERNRDAIKFLVENGAFLPDDINDSRFNPPLHYCPGLEWAYEEMKRLQDENSSSAGESSYSSGS